MTTWDPAKKDASITLSGGNLIALGTSPFFKSVLGTTSFATVGKRYFEVTANVTASGFTTVGIGNGSTDLTNFIGLNTNSIGYIRDGRVLFNNTTQATIATWTAGDVVCVAVDLALQKIWFRKNGGNWNNDVIANQNPATGVGGVSIIPLVSPPYFPGFTAGNSTGDQVTANFGATAFAQTPPAGFFSWATPYVPPTTNTLWTTISGNGGGTQVFTKSNGDNTVTMNPTGGGVGSALSNMSKSVAGNKWYAEIKCESKSSAGVYGIANSSWNMNMTGGTSANGAYINANGNTVINNTVVQTGGAEGAFVGTTLRIALDLALNKIWFAQGGASGVKSQWNLDNANNDPATGLGGYDISGWSHGALMLMCNMQNTFDAYTLRPTSGLFVYSMPSGFQQWDDADALSNRKRSYATVIN